MRCELGVLAASAGYKKWASAQGDLGDAGEADITQQLISAAGPPVRGSALPWLNLAPFWATSPFARSLRQWLQDRGDYGEEFTAGLLSAVSWLLNQAGSGTPDDPEAGLFADAVGRFWETSDSDVRALIAAAVALAVVLGSTVGEVPPIIGWFAAFLGASLPDPPAEAAGMHSFADDLTEEERAQIGVISWNGIYDR